MKKISITLIFSFLIPGAGHLYLGNKIKGVVLLCLSLSLKFLSDKLPLTSLAILIIMVYALVDSYKLFKTVNEYESARSE